jgi:uncharacterized repeat protein (TIGR03803 family)
LTPNTNGKWSEKVLTTWGSNRRDGQAPATPEAGLICDAKGNLYGTTSNGGAHHIGTVFKLTPEKNGNWRQTVLHSFSFSGEEPDGWSPSAGVIFDTAGNLYGTTAAGGSYGCGGNGCGTVLEITP